MTMIEKDEFDLISKTLIETNIDYTNLYFEDIEPKEKETDCYYKTEAVVTLLLKDGTTIEGRSFYGKLYAIQKFVINVKEYAIYKDLKDKGLI